MRNSERLMWFAIGAAIGAGVALLYAPKSGKETRKAIRRKAEDVKESLIETGGQIRDTLAEKGENILDAGRDVYRRGVHAASEAAEEAAGLFVRARNQVRG